MLVDGNEVSQDALDKAAVWACTTLHFSLGELRGYLSRIRGIEMHCEEVAHRLIQKWKKEGKVLFRKSQWHWQKTTK